MLVGWSLRSKVIGQEDHGLNFGATGSIAYTSLSACFRPLLGTWVAYIMFTVHLWGKTFLSTVVRRPGLLLVVAMQPLVSTFGI